MFPYSSGVLPMWECISPFYLLKFDSSWPHWTWTKLVDNNITIILLLVNNRVTERHNSQMRTRMFCTHDNNNALLKNWVTDSYLKLYSYWVKHGTENHITNGIYEAQYRAHNNFTTFTRELKTIRLTWATYRMKWIHKTMAPSWTCVHMNRK